MATISSKKDLIDYAFRKLGSPVVEINVDYQQAEDRLEDALEYFQERHFDGVDKAFFRYQVTEDDITNQYINTDDFGPLNGITSDASAPKGSDIVSVTKLLQFGDFANINMFDVRYQMALSDYFGINRGLGGQAALGLASYDQTKRYINLIEDFFQPEKALRFNKVSNRIYVEMNWAEDIKAGQYLIIQAYAKLNPEIFTEIYNDRYLKEYFTALLKRQWGQNLSKFDGVQMPGGVVLRGTQIFQEAQLDIEKIEQTLLSNYELPVDFMTG
jgi:hypothetical protein